MGFMLPSPTNPREHARALMSQKENIEAELDAQFSILKTNNVDMTTPLVDREGFPRADLSRRYMIHRQLDHHPLHLRRLAQHTSLTDSAESLLAFARVDGVAPSSPAAEAGLRREDLILKFGSLARSSFTCKCHIVPHES
ncbi:uncharacterized protein BJ212DRAFT_1330217 [Suillus subaureus]|uniref:Nas2 N-terminal domain-containing protein n=1 Tax=Suillus subaureus TaxID=48587 RepID=A0A9P7EIB4_9AGAM|nr:uncharacterized protein BJ212DRAFT_1330217 [Suillus subaureus]KAG1822742.1 hypothetical protein BJ212DRAFT_1330217 [Suillus subaureus]